MIWAQIIDIVLNEIGWIVICGFKSQWEMHINTWRVLSQPFSLFAIEKLVRYIQDVLHNIQGCSHTHNWQINNCSESIALIVRLQIRLPFPESITMRYVFLFITGKERLTIPLPTHILVTKIFSPVRLAWANPVATCRAPAKKGKDKLGVFQ